MKKTLGIFAILAMLVTPASTMSNNHYQMSRASERLINALQILQENKGYTESQQVQLVAIQSSLFSLAVEVLTQLETEGVNIEEHEKTQAAQRALSIMFLTSAITGFTPEQTVVVANIRSQSLGLYKEIRSQIVIE